MFWGILVKRAAPQAAFNKGEPELHLCVWIPITGSYMLVPEGNFFAFSHINIICKYF